MGTSPRITDDQRQLLARLVNVEGRSYREASKCCAEGIYGIAPFSVSHATIHKILQRQRQDTDAGVDDLELGDAFDKLARKALRIGNRELTRIDATQGKLDADHFLKIARALRELQPLAKPQTANGTTSKQTFLGEINGTDQRLNGTHQETEQADSPLATGDNDQSDHELEPGLAA